MSERPMTVEQSDEEPGVVRRPAGLPVAVALLGLLLMIVSVFLVWGSESLFGEDRTATNLTSQIYFDTTPSSLDASPIAWHLAVVIVLVGAGLFIERIPRIVVVIGGAGAVLVGVLFLRGIDNVLSDELYGIPGSVTDHVGPGVWAAVAGGVAVIAGALAAGRRP